MGMGKNRNIKSYSQLYCRFHIRAPLRAELHWPVEVRVGPGRSQMLQIRCGLRRLYRLLSRPDVLCRLIGLHLGRDGTHRQCVNMFCGSLLPEALS